MSWVLMTCLAQEEGRFFRKEVDFWESRKAAEKPRWVEPGHTPPREVVEFLEDPTKENAKKYLAWQRERTERLKKAMEVLAELDAEEDRVYYFSKPGCPWCEKQDRELGKMSVVRVPQESPLWARYGVKAVPTLVVVKGGKPRVFQGFTPKATLEKEVGRGR